MEGMVVMRDVAASWDKKIIMVISMLFVFCVFLFFVMCVLYAVIDYQWIVCNENLSLTAR